MCFSATADLVGGVVLAAIGFDTARHVRERRDHLALAVLPLLLAGHQVTEAFVWWGLQGQVSPGVGRVAMWIYLLFAFVLLPVYVPVAVFALEPPGRRRALIAAFIGLGALVSVTLLGSMVEGHVTAVLGDHHLGYSIGLHAGVLVVAAYVVATCGAVMFSGYRRLALFGVVNLIVVAVLARWTIDGLASLWCAWAALSSGALAFHLRRGGSHRSVVTALA